MFSSIALQNVYQPLTEIKEKKQADRQTDKLSFPDKRFAPLGWEWWVWNLPLKCGNIYTSKYKNGLAVGMFS